MLQQGVRLYKNSEVAVINLKSLINGLISTEGRNLLDYVWCSRYRAYSGDRDLAINLRKARSVTFLGTLEGLPSMLGTKTFMWK